MKILFDIGHPAHVHYFRKTIRILESKGHEIAITTRDKEFSLYLLNHYGFEYRCTGKNLSSKLGKLYSILRNDLEIYRVARRFQPDMFVSFLSPFAAHVGRLMNKPVIAFNDTENARIGIAFAKPYTDVFVVPECYEGEFPRDRMVWFRGYFELAYLHPNRFSPNPEIRSLLGISASENYVVMRFVSWAANHDIGHSGISLENKRKAVQEFSRLARVFITSEKPLPEDLQPYRINIPAERIHDALGFASLFYGESATMASESAVLGTPAIYLDDAGRGYTNEQEKQYGLIFNYGESMTEQKESIQKGIELLRQPQIKTEWQGRRQRMLSESIDVTEFMVWFLENYPESSGIAMHDPDYQARFRGQERPENITA